jgi:hypothetical protein
MGAKGHCTLSFASEKVDSPELFHQKRFHADVVAAVVKHRNVIKSKIE